MSVGELLSRLTRSSPLGALLRRVYRERLTARGRYVFWLALMVGFVGIDTLQALVFIVFAMAAGPLVLGLVLALRPRPRVELRAAVPLRLTAGRSMPFRVGVSARGARGGGSLVVGWGRRGPESKGLRFEPCEAYVTCRPEGEAAAQLAVRAERRGRYVLPPLGVGRTDPLGLLATRRVFQASQVVLAYPRFLELGELELPAGRRYQPGGIPLASSTGDATEFIGTRDYREGDPLRRIHWRSWARRGKPVVKEYQEEYFSRVALVLDTFLPRRPRPAERRAFEAAISLLASITDHMSRSEEVVDVLAAGPDLYEVSAGRSLGYLDNVLDVLACLLPCHEPPFEVLAPHLAERLARLTTVVAVVLDWDEGREAFLRRVHGMGAALRVFLVREGPTQRPYDALGEEFGTLTRVDPAELEQRLLAAAAEAPTPGRGQTVPAAATIAPEPS